jgi:hypothetical protein
MRLFIAFLFLIIGLCLLAEPVMPAGIVIREGLEDQYALFTLSSGAVKEDLSGANVFTKVEGGDDTVVWRGGEHYGDLGVAANGLVTYKGDTGQVDYYKRLASFLTVSSPAMPAIVFDRKTTGATNFTIKHKGSQIGRVDGDKVSILQHPNAIALMPFIVGGLLYYRSLGA